MGDFNVRTTNQQTSIFCCKEDHNPFWLIEAENPQWLRCLEDDKVNNHFGEELLMLYGAFNLILSDGLYRWERFGKLTYNTYNGESAVNYIIFPRSLIERIDEVNIGEHMWNL